MIFFETHPTLGKAYQFTNILTGNIEKRTVTQRVKSVRYSDIFNCKQFYFEVTMTTADGRLVIDEYEIKN